MTAQAVDNLNATTPPAEPAPQRWRLNRAGIINVYQYENEVLDFAGGRLLLRGVNGSGKSTAMNMLLPFLLTARPGRIDAAGEQIGILKSWMLSGRDDRQPVGYLWIEFEQQGEFVVCGCGIKANRQSDTVSTWWFVTSKRPGVDVHLVAGDQPLSADALRAELDGDDVFGDRRRSDYRRTVQQRLFGGAPIDQHVGLIHVVRSPRVGDRIDVELPEHLVEALPQLSEQALAEAAQPLDDLEEHRRNVTDLERTSEAIRGLLDVYRSYCAHEMRQRAVEGRSTLATERSRGRDEKHKQEAALAAEAEVVRLDEEIVEHDRTADRLRSEISALEESRAYREGRQLDALRDFVANLARERESAAARVARREERVEATAGDLLRARNRGRDDCAALNIGLAATAELGEHCRVPRRPPGPVAVPETDLTEASVPADRHSRRRPNHPRTRRRRVGPSSRGNADVDRVDESRFVLDTAERTEPAESVLKAASGVLIAARPAWRAAGRLLRARREWHDKTPRMGDGGPLLLREGGLDAPGSPPFCRPTAGRRRTDRRHIRGDDDRAGRGGCGVPRLCGPNLSGLDELIGHRRGRCRRSRAPLIGERASAGERKALSIHWRTARSLSSQNSAGRLPRILPGRSDRFKVHVGEAERCGIEAGARSPLACSLADSSRTPLSERASGEVGRSDGGDPSDDPLSDYLPGDRAAPAQHRLDPQACGARCSPRSRSTCRQRGHRGGRRRFLPGWRPSRAPPQGPGPVHRSSRSPGGARTREAGGVDPLG